MYGLDINAKKIKRKPMTKLSVKTKKQRVRKLYTLDEICEILGYYDESNSDLDYDLLGKMDDDKFEKVIIEKAIINGNFEEAIRTNRRVAL
jgi:cobalamin biosynthesis Co2+ chelatase CbiK